MDQITFTRKQKMLRLLAVYMSIILFPFICFGIGLFNTIDFVLKNGKKLKNNCIIKTLMKELLIIFFN